MYLSAGTARRRANNVKNKRGHILFCAIGVILLSVIQEGFFNYARLFGVKPNILLVFLYLLAVRLPVRQALVAGVCTGLYIDILYSRFLGLYALLFMYFAVLAAGVSYGPLKENRLWMAGMAPPFFILFGMAESFVVRLFMMYTSGTAVLYESYGRHMLERILPVAFYNLLVFAVLFFPVSFAWRKLDPEQKTLYC